MQNLEILRFDMQNLEISRFDMRNLEISIFGMQNIEISRNKWMETMQPFVTLEPRKKIGRVTFSKDFWDCY